jgi:hypothetical protein
LRTLCHSQKFLANSFGEFSTILAKKKGLRLVILNLQTLIESRFLVGDASFELATPAV